MSSWVRKQYFSHMPFSPGAPQVTGDIQVPRGSVRGSWRQRGWRLGGTESWHTDPPHNSQGDLLNLGPQTLLCSCAAGPRRHSPA